MATATKDQAAQERLDKIEAAVCGLAEAVRGTGQAGRWAFEQHFEITGNGETAKVALR